LYQTFLLWVCIKLDWPYISGELPLKIGGNVEGRIKIDRTIKKKPRAST
jgi:hypothetical protein